MSKPGGKFGAIKKQHGRIEGLDELLERIVRDCPYVDRVIPGRMGRKRGKTKPALRFKYLTSGGGDAPVNDDSPATGFKCIYTRAGSWQEVFFICSNAEAGRTWLEKQNITT